MTGGQTTASSRRPGMSGILFKEKSESLEKTQENQGKNNYHHRQFALSDIPNSCSASTQPEFLPVPPGLPQGLLLQTLYLGHHIQLSSKKYKHARRPRQVRQLRLNNSTQRPGLIPGQGTKILRQAVGWGGGGGGITKAS